MSIQDIVKRAVLALGFEERAGTVAYDSSPKANNGTLLKSNGVLPAWVAGKSGFGGAIDFDGTGAYVEVPDNASLTFGDGTSDEPFTVSVWIDADDITSFCPIGKGIYNTDAEWRLLISADDKVYFQTFDESVANCYIGRMYDTVLTGYEGTYIHIVGTYDGSGASTGFKIYINGIRVDDTTYENEAGSYVAMENALNHAVWVARDAANYSNGKVDEVLVLPWELTDAEVRALYESRSAFTATPNLRRGLVLDLDLQEGAGLVAHDRSWYSKNGTITGADWVAGNVGRALDFISTNTDKLDCGNVSASVRTIAFWINLDSTTEDILELNAADRIIAVSGVLSAVSFVGTATIYVNSLLGTGISASEWTFVVITSDANENASALVVAFVNAGYNDFKLQDLKVYDRALSPAEIRAIYEGGR